MFDFFVFDFFVFAFLPERFSSFNCLSCEVTVSSWRRMFLLALVVSAWMRSRMAGALTLGSSSRIICASLVAGAVSSVTVNALSLISMSFVWTVSMYRVVGSKKISVSVLSKQEQQYVPMLLKTSSSAGVHFCLNAWLNARSRLCISPGILSGGGIQSDLR